MPANAAEHWKSIFPFLDVTWKCSGRSDFQLYSAAILSNLPASKLLNATPHGSTVFGSPDTATLSMHGSPSTSAPSRRSKSSRFTTPTPVPQQTSFSSSSPSKFPDSSEPTFYSCISIPVEGAVPIEAEPVKPAKPPQSEPADQKRAPRKSKTDALAALKERDIPQMVERDDSEPPDILAERYQNVAPIPVPTTLDLSTVRTTSPRHYRPPGHISRPFDLEECPSYYPTSEEFKDPMAYVKSIADQARNYGICKIVPPDGWKMPFVTDTEVRYWFWRCSGDFGSDVLPQDFSF